MRIALVLETSGGGSGRHVLDLAKGLVANGQDVSVIWSPVRAQQDFVDELNALQNVKTFEFPMSRAVGPKDVFDLFALKRLLKEVGPFDMVHAHSSKAGALVRLLPRSVPGLRLYTPHAFATMDPNIKVAKHALYSLVERRLALRSDGIIAVSQAEFDHAVELGIDPSLMRIVVNGASLAKEATRKGAREKMKLQDNEVAIGLIGRLAAQKDPLRFVEAINIATKEAHNIRGIVIGDGSLLEEAQCADKKGVVSFLGWQDAPSLMAGLDILCMTSQFEAMPYTLVEALHAKLPIVSTAVGGTHETIKHDENGFVHAVDCSPADIAGSLIELAHNSQLRQRFSEASSTMSSERTIDAMVDQTMGFYRDLVSNDRRLFQSSEVSSSSLEQI